MNAQFTLLTQGKHQRAAPFPQGPFVLAAALRCPVLLMFALRQQGKLRRSPAKKLTPDHPAFATALAINRGAIADNRHPFAIASAVANAG
jgi:predicted LPLAT superfamily acyltransferase